MQGQLLRFRLRPHSGTSFLRFPVPFNQQLQSLYAHPDSGAGILAHLRTLIEKVLKSGHKSTLEHAVFTIALRDVSVLAEQFFIEHRLASFTVKSRRYVDFTGQGYYIPPDLKGDVLAAYQSYMDPLFDAYHSLMFQRRLVSRFQNLFNKRPVFFTAPGVFKDFHRIP